MSKLLHSKIIGEGKPLLILHGLLGMGDNWISLARRYADAGFQVHLIDQRNHGNSFHNDEMNYEAMTADLIHYINKHNLSDVILLGHSMGGKTAMYFSVNQPGRVQKLIVVDIAPKYYPPHHHFIFDAIDRLNLSLYASRKEIEKALSFQIESLQIRQFILKNLKREGKSFAWKPNISVLRESLDELGAALPPYTVYDKPVLFVKGAYSKYIVQGDEALIKAHFPLAKIINIKKAGHWLHAEQPDVFYKETLAFLGK